MELGYELYESTTSQMIMARTYHGLFVPHTMHLQLQIYRICGQYEASTTFQVRGG